MKLYRVDVTLHATAYVKADSVRDAEQKAFDRFEGQPFELLADDDLISCRQYDDPDLPDVSLSPAVTGELDVGEGDDKGNCPGVELVESYSGNVTPGSNQP